MTVCNVPEVSRLSGNRQGDHRDELQRTSSHFFFKKAWGLRCVW